MPKLTEKTIRYGRAYGWTDGWTDGRNYHTIKNIHINYINKIGF